MNGYLSRLRILFVWNQIVKLLYWWENPNLQVYKNLYLIRIKFAELN